MFSTMNCCWLLLLKSLEQTLTQGRQAVLLLLWLKKRQKLFSLEVTFCDFHASKSEVEGFFPLPSSDIIHLVGWCISTHHIRWLMFWTDGCKRVVPWARRGWRLAHTDVETDEMPPPRFHVTESVQPFFFLSALVQFISFLGSGTRHSHVDTRQIFSLISCSVAFLLFIRKNIAIDKLKKTVQIEKTLLTCWILQLGFIFLQSPLLLIRLEKL